MDFYASQRLYARQQRHVQRAEMNQDAQVHVVLDVDGTTAPITVVSGEERPYYDTLRNRCKRTTDFRRDYRRPDEPSDGYLSTIRKGLSSCCRCDAQARRKMFSKRFPVWRIMKKYQWRTDLPNDLVSGLTVGIMQLPQGMAYALLAELPPVVGLYMAFFPVLIYFLFGTSRHISMGTVALCSLLTGSVISRFYTPELAATVLGTNRTEGILHNMTIPENAKDEPVEIELPNDVKFAIASSVCLLVGIVQTAMGFLKMGFITTYMSDPMIGGFTTGAAVHVGTSQVKYVFGLHIPRSDGVFQIPKTYALIFHHIGESNVPTLVMSAVCMVILYVVKVHVNQRFKDKMRFPVPVELFVVVAATLVSHYLSFAEKYHMKIVGKIPPGLPTPTMPSLPKASVYTADAFIIAIVAFSQCVSLAALFAKKHGYSYDPNQELIAYGLGNVFGSFFACYPYAASVSRSSVQESAGGRTQLASVVSATMVLIVIVSIGPLFESLPNCVLASMIMVALRSLFLQFKELPHIYRTSAYDFWIWVVTFLSTVVLHVDYGILLGMLFSFFTVVVRAQRTKAENLQKIDELYVYENSSQFRQTQSTAGVKVIGFNSPIYYANGALFMKQVFAVSGVVPEKRLKALKKMQKADDANTNGTNHFVTLVNESNEMSSSLSLDKGGGGEEKSSAARAGRGRWTDAAKGSTRQANMVTASVDGVLLHHIVLDLSRVCFIDTVGAKILRQVVMDYETVQVTVFLCCVNEEVWRVLDTTGFLDDYDDRLYLTVDDAINAINLRVHVRNTIETKSPKLYRVNTHLDAQESDSLLELDRESTL
ncbi:sulfate transporter-like isoform X2 [Mya arenaria]|uniref:sulfate transporter-like isoform X2 n=1 Tax=Mya arenaria TaxID=6604 RepID=UPI0022E2EAB3|nr:sulfate transporter-like isoform X2 [Mya arenaria]